MTMQDPIADMCTRIRNAQAVAKASVVMPASNLKMAIAAILKEEGYILDCKEHANEGKKQLTITLKYFETKPVISSIKRVSRPGLRSYKGKDDLPKVPGFGTAIVTTSTGVMSAKKARKLGVGGEVICVVN